MYESPDVTIRRLPTEEKLRQAGEAFAAFAASIRLPHAGRVNLIVYPVPNRLGLATHKPRTLVGGAR